MVGEDLIRKMADDLILKLVKKSTTLDTPKKAFIVFCEETTDILRSKVLQILPNDEVVATAELTEKITQIALAKAIVLIAPSIDLAAKITNLQTDNLIASLVIKTLFANKRVIVIASGALAVTDNLRVGLRKAVEDLRCKLVEMGVEFVDIKELAQTLDLRATGLESETNSKNNGSNLSQDIDDLINSQSSNSKVALSLNLANPPKTLANAASLPVVVYPFNQPINLHPSQIKLSAKEKDELSEFVDFLQTKQCSMEKGKPCDRCDICNTLGF